MWFSGGETVGLAHTDDFENILMVFSGTKTVRLFHQDERPSLYFGKIGSGVDSSLSSVNVTAVDMTTHGLVGTTQFVEVELRPGDALYIPVGYVHQVFNHPHRARICA